MAQYIDKDALVTEIERIKKEECPADTYEGRCKMLWFEQFSSFLDTLEVKEVDLNKELNDFIEEQKAWVKDDRVVEYNNGDSFNHIYDLEEIARHFYELGLKTRIGE